MENDLIKKKITEVQNFENGDLGTIIQVQGNQIGQTNISTLKEDIARSVVDEFTESGLSLNIINPIGVVPTYADLSSLTPNLNDAYQVEADGLVYVYTEIGFQAEGEGFQVQAEPNGVVEQGNTQAVSGGEVYFKTASKREILNGVNIYNKENDINGQYITPSGDIVTHATSATSTIFPCKKGDYFYIKNRNFVNTARFVDINGGKLKPLKIDGFPYHGYDIGDNVGCIAPDGAVGFQFTTMLSNATTRGVITLKNNNDGVISIKKELLSESDVIKKITQDVASNSERIDSLEKRDKTKVEVVNGEVYIGSNFNATKDLVRHVSLNGSKNGASNLLNAKLINKGGDLTSSGIILQAQGDAVPTPFQVNVVSSGYLNIGGNHGMASVIDAIATGHDKTENDILSIWTDGTGWEWYLVKIIDANTLRFVSKPKVDGGRDKIKTTPSSPLSHVSGATNTSNVVFTGTAYEYKPAINTITVKLYIDDVEITENGTYYGDVVKIVDTHNVCDPTQPNLVAPYLPQNNGTMVKNTLIHSFFNNGSYTVENITDWQKNHLLTNIGIIQPQVVNKGSYDTIMTYAMNINNASGLDFKNGFDLSLPITNTYVKNNHFLEPTKAVQQLSEILFNGSDPIIGCGFGYNPLVGLGKQDCLLQNENHLLLFNSKKYYPYAYNLRETETNILRGIGYYAYWDATVNPNLSADYFVPFGDSFLYFLNLRTASTKLRVKLSKELLLKEFEVVNSSSNIVLHTENSTTPEGLIVSGSVGDWCILKIR